MNSDNNPRKERPVSYEQTKLLKTKLKDFRNDLIIKQTEQFSNTV